jgi:hypothetical protein
MDYIKMLSLSIYIYICIYNCKHCIKYHKMVQTLLFWDLTPCHWIAFPVVSKDSSAFIFGAKQFEKKKETAIRTFETLDTTSPMTQRQIPRTLQATL